MNYSILTVAVATGLIGLTSAVLFAVSFARAVYELDERPRFLGLAVLWAVAVVFLPTSIAGFWFAF